MEPLLWMALVILSMSHSIHCDYYDSIDKISELMNLERFYLGEVENFLEVKRQDLDTIKRYYQDIHSGLKHFEGNMEAIESNTAKYLVHPGIHPTAGLEIVHRFSKFWKATLNSIFIYEPYGDLVAKVNDTVRGTIPSNMDLLGSYSAISRLQEIYDLSSQQLSRGNVAGMKSVSSMDLDDCRNMGLISIRRTQLDKGLEWLKIAKSKTKNPRIQSHLETLWRICNAGYEVLEDTSIGINETVTVKDEPEIDDTSTRLFWEGSEALYAVEEEEEEEEEGSEAILELSETINITATKPPNYNEYVKLCQKEYSVPEASNRLCHLQRAKFTYGMWKKEEIATDPLTFIFYDIISDEEIKLLKGFHANKPIKAATGVLRSGVTEERVGKIYFLTNDSTGERSVETKISRRISDMTGLDCENYAEALQVSHYGIGGHYQPHYDSSYQFEKVLVEGKYQGNRFATYMLYLNDVHRGGATVFPKANIAVKPVKGAGIFWWNISIEDGMEIPSSLHAGCPVLVGNKWVVNKWIHLNYSPPLPKY